MNLKLAQITAVIIATASFLIMCLLWCRRRRNQTTVLNTPQTPNQNIYTVPTYYYNTIPVQIAPSVNPGHNRIASQGDRFAVPLDLLPPNFDFNAPGVQHKGDHVLVKDLGIIQVPNRDEYQKQSPYNPNYSL